MKNMNGEERLIVTWDVFEYPWTNLCKNGFPWLIVTWDVFEYIIPCKFQQIRIWLIVTWDVFEFLEKPAWDRIKARLIVTWDVFEYRWIFHISLSLQINSNMRCIWIFAPPWIDCCILWLIVTWDVFEYPFYSSRKSPESGLIVTWDVFEYLSIFPFPPQSPD